MTKAKNSVTSAEATVPRNKKELSRAKEFRRSQNINAAFDTLQQRIPYLRPEERKQMPKIKTLRLAMQYIHHLQKLAKGDEMIETDCNETRPLTHTDFRQTVTNEMRVRNSYRERAHSQEMDPAMVQRILAREESRRRCVTIPDNSQGSSQHVRQFGPMSSNVYNFRQLSPQQINAHYISLQTPMMMMSPFPSQTENFHQFDNFNFPQNGMMNPYMV